jgi:uncharacterized protein YcbX
MKVSALFVYPVKSCRGVRLSEADVAERGLAFDRRFMVVDPEGAFLTQRQLASLARVTTELLPEALRLSAPGADALEVPLAPSTGPRVRVRVWGFTGEAVEYEPAAAWLSSQLGVPARLVYMPDDVRRPVSPARARPGDIVSFADGYPLLLVSQGSLDELNARLATPVGVERFRPNLVVEGATPYAEDAWSRLVVRGVPFRVAKPCDRCAVVNVDPRTGEREAEPLRTLATYRKQGEKVFFGVNLVHEACGTIHVGDRVALDPS